MSFQINKTASIADFQICAQWMASSDPWMTLKMDQEQCMQSFGGNFREVYLLQEADQLKGFVIIQPLGSFKGYIQTICVNPSYRGLGYGTALLQFAEQLILSYSPNIFICVSSFNLKAYKLYKNMGFELIGELKDFVKTGYTELLLRKSHGPMMGYTSKIK